MSKLFESIDFSPVIAGPMSLVAGSGRSVATDFLQSPGRVSSFFVRSQQLCNRGGAVVGPATLIFGPNGRLA